MLSSVALFFFSLKFTLLQNNSFFLTGAIILLEIILPKTKIAANSLSGTTVWLFLMRYLEVHKQKSQPSALTGIFYDEIVFVVLFVFSQMWVGNTRFGRNSMKIFQIHIKRYTFGRNR
ncbi:MAG: hypothetical protein IKR52_01255 [Paludibacteraceae bacterium]|nr:hypothetical protein [Paludibacteraceae bacterium]